MRPLAVALALAACAFGARADASQGPETQAESRQEEPEDDWQAIVRLMHLTRDRGGPPVSELVPMIVPHVEKRLPQVLAILHERRAPPFEQEEALRLSPAQQDLLTGALESLARPIVIDALDHFLAGQSGEDARRLRIQVEGCVGSASELALVLELAFHDEEILLSPELEPYLRPALAKILGRDPLASQKWLLAEWRDLKDPLLVPLVLALGDADKADAVAVLVEIATWREDLAFLAIAQVRSIGPSPSEIVNAALIDVIHRRLDPSRTDRAQTYVQVLGELSDFSAVPQLLDLLGVEHEGLRKSALWALQRMSAMPMPASAALWRHWYQKELGWARTEREDTIARLTSRSRAEAVAAVQEIARHRYQRHELARALATALQSPDAEVRLAACRALGALASPRSGASLEECTDDPDRRVALAALGALQRIQGSLEPRGHGKRSELVAQ